MKKFTGILLFSLLLVLGCSMQSCTVRATTSTAVVRPAPRTNVVVVQKRPRRQRRAHTVVVVRR